MKVITDIDEAARFCAGGSAVTIGTFDGVHIAHATLIDNLVKDARRAALKSVLITFYPHPKQVVAPDEAPQLLSVREEKLELLQNRGLDAVFFISFDQQIAHVTAPQFLEEYLVGKFSVKKLVVGYNHAFGYRREGTADFMKDNAQRYGYEFSLTEPIILEGEPVHSSRIRHEIRHGDFDLSLRMLGHDFIITGTVVRGKGLGQQLGFPTINLKVPPEKLVPPTGVYAAYVDSSSDRYYGMMYVGETLQEYALEVNLFDFNNELYNKQVKVCPTRFIRRSIRFDNHRELVSQIKRDEKNIRDVFHLD
ncbi:MAG: bifunctional riboflavin kinase/FAD synthetase [candidate division Zixibacteria bacterium]|nr:bifunctional riboflavin kinase/FAD synthetase [candidate division Zixibacteria bacterium]